MTTRLNYVLPIARQLLLSSSRRLRPGGLAATLPSSEGGRPFVIVTGAGRSGTSAVARVLHESGVSMGTEFDEPSEDNRVGFYEDAGVRAINQAILGEVGLAAMRRAATWPWRSAVLAIAGRHEGEMRELARDAEGGWKDPLFAVTLEAWLRHLPRRPKIVLCLRSPEAFLHSATRIYGLVSRDMVERRWASDFRRLLAIIGDYELEATCVEYDQLVQHPAEVVARLSSFVGHALDPAYVEPGLRRFSYAVPPRYATLYERVRSIGSNGSAASRPALRGQARRRGPLTDDATDAVRDYLQQVNAVDTKIAAAKREWSQRVGAPDTKINGPRAREEAQSASAVYNQALKEAQEELGPLVPPAAFERYHDLTRSYVDRERLAAELMLRAAEGPHPEPGAMDDAIRAWRLLASPEAAAEARKRRAREYRRALEASGYRGARPRRAQ